MSVSYKLMLADLHEVIDFNNIMNTSLSVKMEDQELLVLKSLKAKLLKKASNLIEKLKEQEANGYQKSATSNIIIPNTIKANSTLREVLLEEYETKLLEASRQISGIAFENVDKKWLRDNIYCYKFYLVSKSVKFDVELIVSIKSKQDFEIYDVTCQFMNIDKCYVLEIEPLTQNITKMKNFSLLTSGISQYTELSTFRSNILCNLEKKKYASLEPCTDKNGGIFVHIQSPKNKQRVYLIFQWSILFLERTWKTEHFFTINSTEAGKNFAEENQILLKDFCKVCVEKNNLVDLWGKLCGAIDFYEST